MVQTIQREFRSCGAKTGGVVAESLESLDQIFWEPGSVAIVANRANSRTLVQSLLVCFDQTSTFRPPKYQFQFQKRRHLFIGSHKRNASRCCDARRQSRLFARERRLLRAWSRT